MDLTSKKVVKNIIKLAMCIRKSSFNDLVLLASMIDVKMKDDVHNFDDERRKTRAEILRNVHLCALLGIKDKE